jgi:hypothetical protein
MSQESEAVEAGLNNVAEAIRVALGTGRDTIGQSVRTALVKDSFGEKESRIESAIYKGLRDGIREGMVAAEKLRIANDKDNHDRKQS